MRHDVQLDAAGAPGAPGALAAGVPAAMNPQAVAFYRDVLRGLIDAGVPFVIGGAYAFALYTGIERPTKDIDLFVRRADVERIGAVAAHEKAVSLLPRERALAGQVPMLVLMVGYTTAGLVLLFSP